MKGLDFSFEKAYWQQGKNIVVGIDEVGRGPLAGPVVVGAVALSADCALVEGVLDSKKIPKKKHSLRAQQLKESGLVYGIGVGTVEQINSYGIVKAIQLAIEESLKKIIEYHQVVIDGIAFKEALPLKSGVDFVVKGDSKSYAIAAASILAKEYRDHFMSVLSKDFPHYGWDTNAGYGTKLHCEAIKERGICQHHRTLFVRKLLK